MPSNKPQPDQQTERDMAVDLAHRILDRPNADPDDDIAVLARAFVRERDRSRQAIHSIVFETVVDSLKDYAPGLAEASREAIGRSLAIKLSNRLSP